MNEDDIFAEALEIAGREQRDAFLDDVCAGNDNLRRSVEELLALTDTDDGFLETPALGPGEPVDDVRPGAIIDRYRLISRVGEGGFGEVWRAEQNEPVQRIVAVKVIKPGMDTRQVISRFEAERQTLAMMSHRNIAAVLDAGSTDRGRPYFVMEFIDGLSIDEYCDQRQLPIDDRLRLFAQICRAIHHAHRKGVVHRDIKPSNIIVAHGDTGADARVIDFGIAKAMVTPDGRDVSATVSRQLLGTPEYMCPEQMTGSSDIDTRADVYALGGVLYKLLVGVAPLDATALRRTGLDELTRSIREDDAPRPSSRILTVERSTDIARQRATLPSILSRRLRGDIDWIVIKALEKERARRYDSASDLARDIERHLACEPVVASPPGLLYTTGKFIQRHRMGVFAASIAFLAMISIAVLATVSYFELQVERDRTHREWVRAEREKQEAQQQRDDANRQRRLAEQEQKRAGDQQKKALQFSQLLEDLLFAASPESGNPADLTVREHLDQFAKTLSEQLADQPLAEARLRRLMGQMNLSLRQWTKAGTHLERALALRQQELGENDPLTVQSRVDWAKWAYAQSRLGEAESALEAALTQLKAQPPGEELVLALDVLAKVRRLQGAHNESRSLVHEAWNLSRRIYGADHPRTIRFQGAVALHRLRRQNSEEAESLARNAVQRMRTAVSDDHIGVAMARHFLARVLLQTGDLDEAETLIRSSLEVHRRVVGDDSVAVVSDLVTLAKIVRADDRFDDALQIAREAVTLAQAVTQEAESGQFQAYDLLSNMLRSVDANESVEIRLKAIEARRRLVPNHPDMVDDLRQVAVQLRRLQRFDDAARCFRQAITHLKENDGEVRAQTATLHDLADLLIEAKQTEEAIDCLHQLSVDSPTPMPMAIIDLMDVLVANNDMDEAQELAKKLTGFGKDRVYLSIASRVAEAQLLIAAGDVSSARSQLIVLLSELGVAARHMRLGDRIAHELIDCDILESRFASAETALLRSMNRVRRRGFFAIDRRRTVRRMAELHEAWDRPEKAAEWRRKLQSETLRK